MATEALCRQNGISYVRRVASRRRMRRALTLESRNADIGFFVDEWPADASAAAPLRLRAWPLTRFRRRQETTMTFPRVALREAPRRLARVALAASGILALFVLPGSAQQPAQQQPVTLTGKVTNAAGLPLGQATVLVRDLNVGATTRPDGSYTLAVPGARVPPGPVTVVARAVGFKPATAQVTLRGGTVRQNFTLPENPLRLGEIVVTGAGTVSETEKLGTGRSYVDSAAITSSNEPNLVNALAAKAPNEIG